MSAARHLHRLAENESAHCTQKRRQLVQFQRSTLRGVYFRVFDVIACHGYKEISRVDSCNTIALLFIATVSRPARAGLRNRIKFLIQVTLYDDVRARARGNDVCHVIPREITADIVRTRVS